MEQREYVCIDLHRRRSVIVRIDCQREVLGEARIYNEPLALTVGERGGLGRETLGREGPIVPGAGSGIGRATAARPLAQARVTSEDVRRREREGRRPVVAELAGQALVVALGEPPMPLDRDVQVVVDAEGVAPLARVPVLAKLDDVEAATGGPVVADANDRVENDELEEVELLDRPADEVAQGYWARKFHDRPGDGVDVDGCIREKEGLQIRPAAPGDHIGVCGLETGDGQVGERVVVHPGSMPAPEPIVATPSRAGCQSVCLRRLKIR